MLVSAARRRAESWLKKLGSSNYFERQSQIFDTENNAYLKVNFVSEFSWHDKNFVNSLKWGRNCLFFCHEATDDCKLSVCRSLCTDIVIIHKALGILG